jgi:hypothetical protein
LPEGNWPFRVNPKNGEVREVYTSSAIYAVMLFEALSKGNENRWAEAKAKALKWIGCNRLSSHDVETFKGLDSR